MNAPCEPSDGFDSDQVSPDYVPTSHLRPSLQVEVLLTQAHGRLAPNDEGAVGDVDAAFSIQGASKPFVFALICQAIGAEAAPTIGALATSQPVVLASRSMMGQVFTQTYGYSGSEIDLIGRGIVPAGYLSGLKARLLLDLALRAGGGVASVREAFGPYQ